MAELPSQEGNSGAQEGLSPFATRRPVGRWTLWAVCAALIGGFLAVDFVTPLAMPDEAIMIFGVLVGLCIAQVNLIATWAVLAPGNLVVRLPWALLLAMLMWFAIVLGGQTAGHFVSGERVVLGIILLGSSVLLQVPLWIAKKVFAWRMIREGDTSDLAREDRQFDLRQMLLGTLLLALALAPVRFLIPREALGSPQDLHRIPIMLGVVFLCNLVVTVPCICGGLILATRLVPLALGWLAYCLLLTLLEILVLSVLLGPPGESFLKVCSIFYLLNVAQCAAVFGTLRMFRRLGFRLVRWRAEHAPQAA